MAAPWLSDEQLKAENVLAGICLAVVSLRYFAPLPDRLLFVAAGAAIASGMLLIRRGRNIGWLALVVGLLNAIHPLEWRPHAWSLGGVIVTSLVAACSLTLVGFALARNLRGRREEREQAAAAARPSV